MYIFFFFFNDTATTEIYTLSLHDALPISEIYWDTNVSGTLALLEAMRAADCRRIVFSSTAATYGEPEQVPIREDAPTRPTNTYGATKLAVDAMLTSYAAAYDFAAVSLRYFNVAGAAYGLGERHTTETHLIPIALQVVAGQRDHLTIYGEDYPPPDGTCIRDYIDRKSTRLNSSHANISYAVF